MSRLADNALVFHVLQQLIISPAVSPIVCARILEHVMLLLPRLDKETQDVSITYTKLLRHVFSAIQASPQNEVPSGVVAALRSSHVPRSWCSSRIWPTLSTTA